MSVDDGSPIAYLALKRGTPVFTSDGIDLGTVDRVLQVPEKDLFEGLVVRTHDGARFVDRDSVSSIAEHAVRLTIDAAEARRLGPPDGPSVFNVDPTEGAGTSLRSRWNRLFRRGRWKRVS
jgi:hypothetical protein